MVNRKYFSRKFILSIIVVVLAATIPVWFRVNEVQDMVTLSVIALFTGVGVAYGFINVKDAKLEKEKQNE